MTHEKLEAFVKEMAREHNALELKVTELAATVEDLKNVLMGNGVERERYDALRAGALAPEPGRVKPDIR